jgi:hypothetical protein
MSVRAEIEVVGIKEALREINQISPAARREITKDFKRITKPVTDLARNRVPKEPPLSGWGRSWQTPGTRFQMLPWNSAPAQKLIDAKVSGKRPREYAGQIRDLAVLIIRWRGTVNTLYDMSQKPETPQGAVMIAALERRWGVASRNMWPAYEAKEDEVINAIRDQIEQVMDQVNRKINRNAL